MNQNMQKRSFPVTEIVSVLLAILIGVLFSLAIAKEFSTDIGHFTVGAPLFSCFAGGSVLAVLTSAGAALLAKTKKWDVPSPLTTDFAAVIAPSAAAFAALLFFAAELRNCIRFGTSSLPELGKLIFLPGIAAFFLLGVIPKLKGSKLHGAAGILACLSVNCLLFSGYFDFTLPLNSPIRNALVVMEAVYLLALLVSTASIVRKAVPFLCYFVKCTAVSLMGGISLGLILAALVTPDRVPDGVSVLWCVLCLFSAVAMLFQSFDCYSEEAASAEPTEANNSTTEL